MSQAIIKILLVDDHAVVRAGIRRLLEQHLGFSVVAEAESGERAYQVFGECLPDVCVMDLTMPGMGGLEGIKRILARYSTAKILVLSMHENAAFASQSLKAGAKGYLPKSSLAEELVNALEAVSQGKVYLSADIAKKIALHSLENKTHPMEQLSAREFEIFRMLAEGVEVEEVARLLKISAKTVSNYQTIIRQKLGVNSPIEIVRLALRYGLIEG